MSCGLQVYQLAHSQEEFPHGHQHHGIEFGKGWEFLRHWVGHELFGGEPGVRLPGQYNFRSYPKYNVVHAGDVILLLKDRFIVAGGLVNSGPIAEPLTETPYEGGPAIYYQGHLTFDPGSLITFDPPVPQQEIKPVYSDSGTVLIKGFDGPRYRGPQFGRPWLLEPEQHEFVIDLISMITEAGHS